MSPNFIDYDFMYLIPLEKGRVRKEQGMLMGGESRMTHDIQMLSPETHKN